LAFGCDVFLELSRRFAEFADVLAEVSEQSRIAAPATIVQLYEHWAATGSRRAALLLGELGITPAVPGTERAQ
jgi:HEAT repeat protein